MAHMVRQSMQDAIRVWAVMSYRAGENSQILGLAESLGEPFEIKRLRYRSIGALGNLARRVGRFGIHTQYSSSLEAPWPRLVISAGLRNEPVCRWVAMASRGYTKIVFLGRTWAPNSEFDLIVTTPQYRLGQEANVLHNLGTLHRITKERLQREAEAWRERLNPSGQPCIAVLIGGRSGPFTFANSAAKRLARLAQERASKLGARLLITSSTRTDPTALRILEGSLISPAAVHRFGEDDNPYFAMLALADELIVTGDSIAMLSEAAATGKPVWLFDLGTGKWAMNPRGTQGTMDHNLRTELYRMLMLVGPKRLSRDLRLVHEGFIEAGLAHWLEEGATPAEGGEAPDLPRTVARIRDTFLRDV